MGCSAGIKQKSAGQRDKEVDFEEGREGFLFSFAVFEEYHQEKGRTQRS